MKRYIDMDKVYTDIEESVGAYYSSEAEVKENCLSEISNARIENVMDRTDFQKALWAIVQKEGVVKGCAQP